MLTSNIRDVSFGAPLAGLQGGENNLKPPLFHVKEEEGSSCLSSLSYVNCGWGGSDIGLGAVLVLAIRLRAEGWPQRLVVRMLSKECLSSSNGLSHCGRTGRI